LSTFSDQITYQQVTFTVQIDRYPLMGNPSVLF
jgi:hypothetical protein